MLELLKDMELAKRDARRDLEASLPCLSLVSVAASAAYSVKTQWHQMAKLSLCSQLHMIFRKSPWVRKIDL